MKGFGRLFFPVVMLVGLVVSVLVFVTALQAVGQAAAVPAGNGATAMVSREQIAGQGRVLFMSKGCIVCHRNKRVTAKEDGTLDMGFAPDLTQVQIDADYLRRWLHDPKGVKPEATMPNLNLSDEEVGALVAFLRGE